MFCIKYWTVTDVITKFKFEIDFSGTLSQNYHNGSHILHMNCAALSFSGILTWVITKPYFCWEITSINFLVNIDLHLVLNADTNNIDLDTVTQMFMNNNVNFKGYKHILPLYDISSLTNQTSDKPSVIIKKTEEELGIMAKFNHDAKFQNPVSGVYYYLESRSKVSWDMANKICEENHHSHLLSVNSQEEDEFVKSIFKFSDLLAWSPIIFLELHSEKQVRGRKC